MIAESATSVRGEMTSGGQAGQRDREEGVAIARDRDEAAEVIRDAERAGGDGAGKPGHERCPAGEERREAAEALAQVDVLAARARPQRAELGVGHRADEREQAAGDPDAEERDGMRHGLRDDARRDEDADADDVRNDDSGGVERTETAFERLRRSDSTDTACIIG